MTTTKDFMLANQTASEFALINKAEKWNDGLFLFFQNIFHLYPEAAYHSLVKNAVKDLQNDKSIYEFILKGLPAIKPLLQSFTHALPALKIQKTEMTRQTLKLLNGKTTIDGYLEIGSPGRYISHLRRFLTLSGDLILINDNEPGYGPPDIFERGGIKKIGRFIPLANYQPITREQIPDNSLDLVTCYIGLHHASLGHLKPFVQSICRTLRPGGRFILRDHDAYDDDMHTFASLVHTVFNAGLGVSWETNSTEIRNFRGLDFWRNFLAESGLTADQQVLFQENDPSLNALLIFTRR